jgi:hypothetical protein
VETRASQKEWYLLSSRVLEVLNKSVGLECTIFSSCLAPLVNKWAKLAAMHRASVPEGQIIAPELFCALIQKKKVTGIPCMHPIYILSHVFNWKAVVREGVCVWGGSFHSIFERQQISWINTESEYQSQSQFKENFFSSFSASIFKQVLKPLLQASRCYFPSPQRAGVQPESCLKSIQTQLLLVAQLIRYQLTIKRKDFEVGYGNHKLDRMSMVWS